MALDKQIDNFRETVEVIQSHSLQQPLQEHGNGITTAITEAALYSTCTKAITEAALYSTCEGTRKRGHHSNH
jgi:hypothetical protein